MMAFIEAERLLAVGGRSHPVCLTPGGNAYVGERASSSGGP